MNECKLRTEDGLCRKWNRKSKCKPSTLDWCDETVEVLEPDVMCRRSSIFGNTFSYITEEHIEELRNGKVIYIDDGEYGHFVALRKEKNND